MYAPLWRARPRPRPRPRSVAHAVLPTCSQACRRDRSYGMCRLRSASLFNPTMAMLVPTLHSLREACDVYTVGEFVTSSCCWRVRPSRRERGMIDLNAMHVTIDSNAACEILAADDTPDGLMLRVSASAAWLLGAPCIPGTCASIDLLRNGSRVHALHAWCGPPSPELTPAASTVALLRTRARARARVTPHAAVSDESL